MDPCPLQRELCLARHISLREAESTPARAGAVPVEIGVDLFSPGTQGYRRFNSLTVCPQCHSDFPRVDRAPCGVTLSMAGCCPSPSFSRTQRPKGTVADASLAWFRCLGLWQRVMAVSWRGDSGQRRRPLPRTHLLSPKRSLGGRCRRAGGGG